MLWIVHSNVKYTKLLLKCTFLIVTLWPVIFNKWLWIARVIIWLTCYDCFCLTMLKAQTLSLRDSESEFKKDCVTNHKPAGITWEQIFVNYDYLFGPFISGSLSITRYRIKVCNIIIPSMISIQDQITVKSFRVMCKTRFTSCSLCNRGRCGPLSSINHTNGNDYSIIYYHVRVNHWTSMTP